MLIGVAPIVIDALTGSLYEISTPEKAPPGLVRNPWDKNLSEYDR